MSAPDVPTASTGVRPPVGVLLAALVVVSSSSTLVLSILPGLTRGLGLTETVGSLVITAAALAYGAFAPAWGRRSERAGRVPVMVVGLSGYALATAAFAGVMLAGASGVLRGAALAGALIASRALGGVFAGAVPSTAQAYLADASTERDRTGAVALIGIASGLGLLVGPALGGALAAVDLTAPLWVSAAAAVLLAPVLRRRLPEPPRAPDPAGPSRLSLRDPRPRFALGLVLALFVANALVSTTLGFLVQDRLGLDEQAAASRTGAVLFALGGGLIAVQVLVRRRQPSPRSLALTGFPVAAGGVALLLPASSLPSFVLAGVVIGVGAGLAISGTIAAATLAVGERDQGVLGGLTVLAQTAGFAIGPLLAGWLYEQAPEVPVVVAAVWLLVATVVVALRLRPAAAGPPR